MTDDVEYGTTIVEEEILDGNDNRVLEDDIFYCERYCACGSLIRIRGHRNQLFGNGQDTFGVVGDFERQHADAPHRMTDEAECLEARDARQQVMNHSIPRGGE